MFKRPPSNLPKSLYRIASGSLLACAATLTTACDGGSGTVSQSTISAPTPTPTPTPPPKFACPGPTPAIPPVGTLDLASLPVVPDEVDLRTVPASPISFSRTDILLNMNYAYGLTVGDFDCDTKPDISFFDSYTGRSFDREAPSAIGYMAWGGGPLEHIVAGDRLPEVTNADNVGLVLIERMVTLDVNGDGFLDSVAVANSHHSVVAYLNPGYRSTTWERVYLSTDTPGAVNLVAGDIDKDGLKDIAVTMREQLGSDPNADTHGVVWLKNPGKEGAVWVQQAIAPSDTMLEARNLQIADFDADGFADVAVGDAISGLVRIFKGNGGTQWTHEDINAVAIHGYFGMALDFDNDQKSEIIQPVYQGLALLRNNNGWKVNRLVNFAPEPIQIVMSNVEVGDLDLDGKADIVFSVESRSNSQSLPRRGGVYWMRQNGTTWEVFEIERTASSVADFKLLDYDRDGDLDIVTNLEYPENNIHVLVNNVK